jgi:hypothetical protein
MYDPFLRSALPSQLPVTRNDYIKHVSFLYGSDQHAPLEWITRRYLRDSVDAASTRRQSSDVVHAEAECVPARKNSLQRSGGMFPASRRHRPALAETVEKCVIAATDHDRGKTSWLLQAALKRVASGLAANPMPRCSFYGWM